MANYIQQCRSCHIYIEGTGEGICYRCLQKERDSYKSALESVVDALPDWPSLDLKKFIINLVGQKR